MEQSIEDISDDVTSVKFAEEFEKKSVPLVEAKLRRYESECHRYSLQRVQLIQSCIDQKTEINTSEIVSSQAGTRIPYSAAQQYAKTLAVELIAKTGIRDQIDSTGDINQKQKVQNTIASIDQKIKEFLDQNIWIPQTSGMICMDKLDKVVDTIENKNVRNCMKALSDEIGYTYGPSHMFGDIAEYNTAKCELITLIGEEIAHCEEVNGSLNLDDYVVGSMQCQIMFEVFAMNPLTLLTKISMKNNHLEPFCCHSISKFIKVSSSLKLLILDGCR